MLLRSSSSPILNSWIPTMGKDFSIDRPELFHSPHRQTSVSFCSATGAGAGVAPSSASSNSSQARLTRALSETDLRDLHHLPAPVPMRRPPPPFPVEESSEEEADKLDRLLSSSGLDEALGRTDGFCSVQVEEKVLVAGGGFGGTGGGIICGGGDGGNGGGGGDGGYGFSNNGNESMDLYYRKMIEADPGNSLLLTNYAKFLKDVHGDVAKAEEYLARSILANPKDGDVLSLYGNLIWEYHKDAKRAGGYFDQAVKAAPDNCYVMASYAHFLWDADEDEEEESLENWEIQAAPNLVSEAASFHRSPPLAAPS